MSRVRSSLPVAVLFGTLAVSLAHADPPELQVFLGHASRATGTITSWDDSLAPEVGSQADIVLGCGFTGTAPEWFARSRVILLISVDAVETGEGVGATILAPLDGQPISELETYGFQLPSAVTSATIGVRPERLQEIFDSVHADQHNICLWSQITVPDLPVGDALIHDWQSWDPCWAGGGPYFETWCPTRSFVVGSSIADDPHALSVSRLLQACVRWQSPTPQVAQDYLRNDWLDLLKQRPTGNVRLSVQALALAPETVPPPGNGPVPISENEPLVGAISIPRRILIHVKPLGYIGPPDLTSTATVVAASESVVYLALGVANTAQSVRFGDPSANVWSPLQPAFPGATAYYFAPVPSGYTYLDISGFSDTVEYGLLPEPWIGFGQ